MTDVSRSALLGTAISVELRKLRAARVVVATSTIVVAGISVLAGSFVLAARGGNAAVIAKLGTFSNGVNWDSYLSTAAQVTAAAVLLALGVVLSWIFGREFSDGTITGLFGLPVGRPTIALAKLVVYFVWATGLAIVLMLALFAVGLALGVGPLTPDVMAGLGRQVALTVLSALIAVPAAWAATLGRGLLAGIGAAVGIMAGAQVMAIAGLGPWFPITAPALWAIAPESVPPAALALVLTVPLVFGALVLLAWRRLQLDR